MVDTFEGLRSRLTDAPLVPFLADVFDITTEYGAPVAAGPNAGEPHNAIDFGTPVGTPLYSPGEGVVLNPADNPAGVTGGNTLTIDYGGGRILTFAHLDSLFVQPGDIIAPGDFIATTGESGIATGPHLHVDAWIDGVHTDVRNLIDWSSDFSDYEQRPGATAGSIPFLGPLTGGAIDAGQSVANMGTAVVAFVTAILNPENWARILALFGGAIIAAIGAFMLWQSTGAA